MSKKKVRAPEEIEAMISKVESDERYNYPPADVFSNAPLALIQVEMKATVDTLKWMLGGPHPLDTVAPRGVRRGVREKKRS